MWACVYSHKDISSSFHMTSASLDRSGFVPAESVMKFRKQLGCKSFATEEKGITCPVAAIYKLFIYGLEGTLLCY